MNEKHLVMPRTPLQVRVDAITADVVTAGALARAAAFDARQALLGSPGIWWRQCFICDAATLCRHREPELVERWEKGLTR